MFAVMLARRADDRVVCMTNNATSTPPALSSKIPLVTKLLPKEISWTAPLCSSVKSGTYLLPSAGGIVVCRSSRSGGVPSSSSSVPTTVSAVADMHGEYMLAIPS
jgi:hypothetical protein